MRPANKNKNKVKEHREQKYDLEEIELDRFEQIRTIEEIDEEDEEYNKDVFEKEKENIVQTKIEMVRSVQASLQHNNKWMWPLTKKIKPFSRPKRTLEQYVTPVHDALSIGFVLEGYLDGKTVADLGAGTGYLGITCLLAGARKVYFYEIDPDAFAVLKKNCATVIDGEEADSEESVDESNLGRQGSKKGQGKAKAPSADSSDEDSEEIGEKNTKEDTGDKHGDGEETKETYFDRQANEVLVTESYTLINRDILTPDPEFVFEKVDCVIMNPPFGTSKDEDIDVAFLKRAVSMTEGKIFFVHKLARTKALAESAKELGRKQRILWEFYLEVPRLKFDADDLLEFAKKGKTKDQVKKAQKGGGMKSRFQHKKDIEHIKCCLVEWFSA